MSPNVRNSLVAYYEFCNKQMEDLTEKAEDLMARKWTKKREVEIRACKDQAMRYCEVMDGIYGQLRDEGLEISLDNEGNAITERLDGQGTEWE